jgi:hypothetical protein
MVHGAWGVASAAWGRGQCRMGASSCFTTSGRHWVMDCLGGVHQPLHGWALPMLPWLQEVVAVCIYGICTECMRASCKLQLRMASNSDGWIRYFMCTLCQWHCCTCHRIHMPGGRVASCRLDWHMGGDAFFDNIPSNMATCTQ